MENNELLNEISEFLSDNHKILDQKLDEINSTRNVTGYPEIKSSTQRAFNSCVDCIKYLKKHNEEENTIKIDYINDLSVNGDKIAIEAWKTYVKSFQKESVEQIFELETFINNKLNHIIISPQMRSRKWKHALYNKLVDINPYLMGYLNPLIKNLPSLRKVTFYHEFVEGRIYIDSYEEICEDITNLDPDKNLIDAFLYYLETIHSINNDRLRYEDKIKIWQDEQKQLDHFYKRMIRVLFKLNKLKDITKLSALYTNILKDNTEKQQAYLLSEQEKFRNEQTNKEKTLSKKLKK